MIKYHYDERKPSKSTISVDFGNCEEWLENIVFEVVAMNNAILNLSVLKYFNNKEREEEFLEMLKDLIIEKWAITDSDLDGFRECVNAD